MENVKDVKNAVESFKKGDSITSFFLDTLILIRNGVANPKNVALEAVKVIEKDFDETLDEIDIAIGSLENDGLATAEEIPPAEEPPDEEA